MITNNLTILQKDAKGTAEVSMLACELDKHIMFLNGEINSTTATDFIHQLIAMNMDETNQLPIKLIITSTGGSVEAGLAIYDAIKSSKLPIYTICIEKAYSMAAILLSAGNKRYIFPHSKVMIHQPIVNSNISGDIQDLHSLTDNLSDVYSTITQILCETTKKSKEEIEQAISYDHYFSAEEAIQFHLVDEYIGFSALMNDL